MAMSRMTSTKAVVCVIMPDRNRRWLSDSVKTSTRTAKPSLPSDFRNSTKPWTPNSRFQPFEIEMRDACGRMRSPTNCGRFWKAEAPTPATTSRISRLASALPTSTKTRWHERDHVLLRLERPGVGLFQEHRQERAELDDRLAGEEHGEDQDRDEGGEDRSFARMRQLALLDRVADLLLGRFLGLAVLVGRFGHDGTILSVARGPNGAASGGGALHRRQFEHALAATCGWPSRRSTSAPSRCRPWRCRRNLAPSSDSIMRRERAPIADSTASPSGAGQLRSASVTSSVGQPVEQRHPRLLGQQRDVVEREQPRRGSPRGPACRTARDPA